MSPRQMLLVLAAVLVAAGLVLGFRAVSADGVGCGSAFSPSSSEAKIADGAEAVAGTLEGATPDDPESNAAACDSAIGDAKPFAFGALGLGIVAIIAAFLASSDNRRADGSVKPSMWR